MSKLKKIAVLIFSFANVFATNEANDVTSGISRIIKIMSNDETGIGAFNKKHIHYAETQNIAKDLNIEQIAEFFNCKTVIGKTFLTETLNCPVNPEDKASVLKNRQEAIKLLVENPDLKNEIEELLEIAKVQEEEIIILMSDFFIGKTCPELKQLELLRAQNPAIAPMVEFIHLNPTSKIVTTTLNLTGLATTTAITYFLWRTTYQNAQSGVNCSINALRAAYFNLLACITGYSVYKDYSQAYEKRKKIYALNQFIHIAEKIENLCATNSIESQFKLSAIKDKQGIELIEKLKHARYKAKNAFFFMTPQVHTFLYKIYQQEKYLSELFACIAEMDAYNSIANKILDSGNAQNKFCIAEFIESDKPFIQAQAFWNVLVKNAVSNNISEGKHVLLTGPNAGGKTTSIRALLQNIILAQSFGVAAAETWRATFFDVIHSYLNISDDISQGLSLFASEVKRAQEIVQKIKSLEANKKFFFALDELFTGTVSEDGETCAYEFVKRISEFPGVQFIYATHFNKLKELGLDNILRANYKVDAPIKNDQGKLVYPYTLSQGASDSRVALDIVKEANIFD